MQGNIAAPAAAAEASAAEVDLKKIPVYFIKNEDMIISSRNKKKSKENIFLGSQNKILEERKINMMILKINSEVKLSSFFGGDEKEIWSHGDWLDSNEEKQFSAGWTGIFVVEVEGVTHTYILEDWYGFAIDLKIDESFTPRCELIDNRKLKLENLKIGHDFFPEATVLEFGEV